MHVLKIGAFLGILCLVFSCKKSTKDENKPATIDTVAAIQPAVDPPIANTIGFFMDDWQPKTFVAPSYKDTSIPSSTSYTVLVDASSVITKVPRSIAGNNANLWMSQIVTESSLMTHLTNMHPHVIRFPGGSISDVFFWNAQKNAPPPDAPSELVKADGTKESAGYWYGKNSEGWTFSLDNYYQMLQQTNNTGMITINYGYARYSTAANPVAVAAHLAADWVRYDNGRTKYWEIGNENFGDWEAGYRIDRTTNKDGQPEFASGALYAQHFKVFADSMRKAAQEINKVIHIGAVLFDHTPEAWTTNTTKAWNTGVTTQINNSPDFYIVHDYYTPYGQQTSAADILTTGTTETKRLADFVNQTLQTAGATQKPVALTEWNIFAVGLKQQVSHINGMHGVLVIGEALKNKFGMTSRWDLANGWSNGDDHGLFNNGDEPDGVIKWNPRPAFYHLYFFQKFLGDRLVKSELANSSGIDTYASTFSSGQVGVTLVNKTAAVQAVEIKVSNFRLGNRFYWYTLTGGNDNGEFSRKVYVNGSGPSGAAGGPADYASLKAYSALTLQGVKVILPARSIVNMVIDKK